MQANEIKRAAFVAAKDKEMSISECVRGMEPQERLYFLEMLYYYQLYESGRLKLKDAQTMEQQVYSGHLRLDCALKLSEDEYRRFVQRGLDTEMERTKLCKQLLAGDRDFIHTLLHLLDIYTREGIYNQMYRIMRIPMTDTELDKMIDEVPEEYRRNLTPEEARAGVWNVIRHMNGDLGID